MRLKSFRLVIANFVIVAMLGGLLGVTLAGGGTVSVSGDVVKPYYNGNRDKKQISLMINVYWGTEYVLPIAELLAENGANATFFIGGCWADDNVDIVKELHIKGFELGNHGYFHKDHKKLSYESNREEIMICHNLLKEITGKEPKKLFAPPSGSIGSDMLAVCTKEGFDVVMWTRDTIDWRDKDSNLVYSRAVKDMKGGDLILMHPTAHTLEALPDILKYCADNGFEVVTVSQNITE